MPPPEYNPLAPTKDPQFPTELPEGRYDIAVFDNRFPSMALTSHDPPASIVETLPANGACEVVVFTQDPHASLGSLELDHLDLLFQVWADRTRVVGGNPQIQYVLPFENRGVEMGVTLLHPLGQIYADPFVPPVPARMQERQQAYYREHQRGLLQDLIQTPDKLKYLAGTELAAGIFANDALPEAKAKELQAVSVSLEAEV
jgi:UDPglucose--hexose-1-phosphate uridylyltransferase